MNKELSGDSFFAKPLDFAEPLHLKPLKSAGLAICSGILLAISITQLSFMVWVSFVPFWLGLKGRKDKGVFWLGTLFGVSYLLFSKLPKPDFFSLDNSASAILVALRFGFWAWFSRKMYFYLTFPRVNMTIADAPRQQFIFSKFKMFLLCLGSSFLWVFLEWITITTLIRFDGSQLALSQTQNIFILPIAAFSGLLGVSFIIILINMAVALVLESKLIDRQTPLAWSFPLVSILLSLTFIVVCNDLSVTNIPNQSLTVEDIDLNNENAIQQLNKGLVLGSLNSEELTSQNCREFLRNGSNILSIKNSQDINLSIYRAVENGVPIYYQTANDPPLFILPNGQVKHKFIDLPVKVNFEPTFYYRNPNFFTNIVFIATFIAFLASGLHFYKRKTILRDLISGKD
ncbi:MAG: hypothetical protein MK132_03570 [Lentisphaerales bacterium]|nr:hypothetical protein [Lentisphaerales bacterium]